jgi:alkanesulfonate monooxygenase SsuD/methylene tetrahydromethanopterin reductase-like flavin-dependent oxidoreductase (luciferase family)
VRLEQLTARVWVGQTYDELDAIGGFLIGAPDQVAARVQELKTIGVDTLLLVFSFGRLAHERGVPLARAVRSGDDQPSSFMSASTTFGS